MSLLLQYKLKIYALHFAGNFIIFGLLFGFVHWSKSGTSDGLLEEALLYGLGLGLSLSLIPAFLIKYVEIALDQSLSQVIDAIKETHLASQLKHRNNSLVELRLKTPDVHGLPAEIHQKEEQAIFVGSSKQHRVFISILKQKSVFENS
ncbi:MAG: hypothetical protein AAFY36_12555 [Bacteroidota bacterium]